MVSLVFLAILLLLIAFVAGYFLGFFLKGNREEASVGAAPVLKPVAATPPKPQPSAPVKAPTSSDEPGARPAALDAPKAGGPDKLTRVKGIGPVNEKRLHGLGIYHFEQIAAWGENEIAWVDNFLSFKGRIKRDDWVGQAGRFSKE